MDLNLIKAIWASGFRAGKESGEDHACCYERGCKSHQPQTADEAWEQDVRWRLDCENGYRLNSSSQDDWANVP